MVGPETKKIQCNIVKESRGGWREGERRGIEGERERDRKRFINVEELQMVWIQLPN